jgi:hypothetical protein
MSYLVVLLAVLTRNSGPARPGSLRGMRPSPKALNPPIINDLDRDSLVRVKVVGVK